MVRNSKYDAIIIASLYFWPESAFRHSLFKGDAISHPLNPGATPWYFASCKLIEEMCTRNMGYKIPWI